MIEMQHNYDDIIEQILQTVSRNTSIIDNDLGFHDLYFNPKIKVDLIQTLSEWISKEEQSK